MTCWHEYQRNQKIAFVYTQWWTWRQIAAKIWKNDLGVAFREPRSSFQFSIITSAFLLFTWFEPFFIKPVDYSTFNFFITAFVRLRPITSVLYQSNNSYNNYEMFPFLPCTSNVTEFPISETSSKNRVASIFCKIVFVLNNSLLMKQTLSWLELNFFPLNKRLPLALICSVISLSNSHVARMQAKIWSVVNLSLLMAWLMNSERYSCMYKRKGRKLYHNLKF